MDLTGKKWVVVDAECLRDVAPPYSFDRAEFLGNAVTCSINHLDEVKDWIGDGSMFSFYKYLMTYDLIISWNGINFDYPLWGGSMLGPEHIEARKIFEKSFKGRTVDLCLDVKETLGVRTKLVQVSVPTLGDHKEMDGGFAPQHWRNGRCMEVIEYCRGDIRRTAGIFLLAAGGKTLKVQTKDGQIREFTFEPKIR